MPLLILDLETTGLDTQKDHVLEIAAIFLTDNVPTIVPPPRFQRALQLSSVPDHFHISTEVIKMHAASNLWSECAQSELTPENADTLICEDFIDPLMENSADENGKVGPLLLCGNSIHFDRQFLVRFFPKVYGRLHYRQIDLSSLNELAKRVSPKLYEHRPKPARVHRAAVDVEESYQLLRYYAARL